MKSNTAEYYEELIKKIDERIAELDCKEKNENESQVSTREISFDEAACALNDLVGLDEVKEEVEKLVNYLKFIKKIDNKTSMQNLNLHMVFKGNPGTGKTTVARIIADILYSLGYLKNNNIIETTPGDFIAGYVGQTAIKTKKLMGKYQGGLIFVDEAYAFNEDNENSFAREAIAEIIKEMEKKETVFIFAGYNKEMEDFISLNPGLKSRIGYTLEFKDYSKEDLLQIFLSKLMQCGFYIEEDAYEEVGNIVEDKRKEKDFGNGRLIDNLYDKILLEHATINCDATEEKTLLTIKKESVVKTKIKRERGAFFE